MKRTLLSIALLLLVIAAKAQVVNISKQTSCQPIMVIFYADLPANCGTTYHSNPMVINVPLGNVNFDMYPGGPNIPINWAVSPPPGSGAKFTVVRVLDPGGAWNGAVFNPCLGGQIFGPVGACQIHVSSNWQNPKLISLKVY